MPKLSDKEIIKKMIMQCTGRHPTKGCLLCYRNQFQKGTCPAIEYVLEETPADSPLRKDTNGKQ